MDRFNTYSVNLYDRSGNGVGYRTFHTLEQVGCYLAEARRTRFARVTSKAIVLDKEGEAHEISFEEGAEMYDNDVFEVTLFDKHDNEVGFYKIATFSGVTNFLADVALEGTASKAYVRGQHYQESEVNLDELYDRMVVEGYIH